MLETLYQDFTTKFLPLIQEGLSITKDYFFDLFGRYIKYLIITDSIYLSISIFVLVASIIAIIKATSWYRKGDYSSYDDETFWYYAICIVSVIFILVGVLLSIQYTDNLIKDIYIPEVRIIEELQSFKK